MVRANKTITNVSGGEISPLLHGRVDLPVYQKAVAIAENFIIHPQGVARFRQGTTLVKQTRLNSTGVLIPFQFNDTQAYVIEATNLKFRFFTNNGIVFSTTLTITAMTNANPGVFTTSAVHGYAVGDEVQLLTMNGTSQLTNRFFIVNTVPTTTTFTLRTVEGTVLNTTSLGTYTGGGISGKVLEVTTPYVTADLAALKFAQTADTMYIVHKTYEPRKLVRVSATSFTLSTYNRSGSDPHRPTQPTEWPAAVAFSSDGRLVTGGSTGEPETIWATRAPDASDGTPQFDNYNTGTDPTNPNNPYTFQLAPVSGKVDSIRWLANTARTFVIGTYSTVRRLFGAQEGTSATSIEVNAPVATTYGVSTSSPVVDGTTLFFIERGARKLDNLQYDFQIDGYSTTDMNLVSEHLTVPGLNQLCKQLSSPDVLWATLNNGRMLGLTYKEREDIAGWHRHFIGGTHLDSNSVTKNFAKVLWATTIGKDNGVEQLWMIVERRIGSTTIRTVEYLNDEVSYPIEADFYTDQTTEAADKTKYLNAVYEAQKNAIHMDMALTYNGAATGIAANSILTPSATTGTITITASAAVFTSAMVGREIWKKYDSNGDGGGRARITAFTSSTNVTALVLKDFDNANTISPGNWFLTTNTVSNLHLREGQTVNVVADGGPISDKTVSSGSITLDAQASVVHVGYKYRGMLKFLNLDFGGVSGSAQAKPRKLNKLAARFINTVGALFGTNVYRLERIPFESTADVSGRAVPPFNGVKEAKFVDNWASKEKTFTVVQDLPLPCTLASLDLFGDTTDE